MDGLNTVLEYLTSVPAWYLATSVDGQPHVRPFSFAQIQDGKLWFVTARTKDVWQELLQNQRFEATSWWPGHGWLILRGRAGLDDRALGEMREAGWKHLERLGEHYEGYSPRFRVSGDDFLLYRAVYCCHWISRRTGSSYGCQNVFFLSRYRTSSGSL